MRHQSHRAVESAALEDEMINLPQQQQLLQLTNYYYKYYNYKSSPTVQ